MIMLNRQAGHLPRTVGEAVERVLTALTDAQKDELRTTPDDDLDLLHFGLGAAIRNECGLWKGNVDLLASCGSSDMHPDSASDVILRAAWKHLRGDQ